LLGKLAQFATPPREISIAPAGAHSPVVQKPVVATTG